MQKADLHIAKGAALLVVLCTIYLVRLYCHAHQEECVQHFFSSSSGDTSDSPLRGKSTATVYGDEVLAL